MAACEFNHLRNFSFCDLVREDAANPHAVTMHVKHDLHRLVPRRLQHFDQFQTPFGVVDDEASFREIFSVVRFSTFATLSEVERKLDFGAVRSA